MSAQHTPGPWQAKPPRIGAAITIYGADGEFPVATTCSNTFPATMQAHRDGTVAANARLIAAAPDTAAKAMAFTLLVERFFRGGDGISTFVPTTETEVAAAMYELRAHIAKATGAAS